MKLPIAVFALFFAAATAVTAQPAPAPTLTITPGETLLNVTAEGRSRRQPDLAIFSAGVVTQAKTAGEALTANAQRMDAVIAALKRAGIAERDIQTSTLTLQPQYTQPRPPEPYPRRDPAGAVIEPAEPQAPRIIGYEARNSVQVRVRRLGEMGRVIDTLVSAGANQVDGPSFTVEEPEPALDEARVAAMQRARERAELYAKAAGLRVGRIISISEQGGYFPVAEQIVVTGYRGGPAAPPPPPSPVQPGEVALGVNLTVQFALVR
ncbi:SIMPL domain-containing protein [Phenylobacterium terrae]|uniref:SIMPL domain-containing protein n=1 Tax=Phenylobacterium terrae TaxID=2665495 RepID=A0ABW4N5S0_9CAUL